MNKVHIIVDSTANIPPEFLSRHDNLHIVPLKITLGDKTYEDCEIDSEYVVEYVKSTGNFPKTSQPAPGDFVKIISSIVENGDSAVIITLSAGLSGTFQSACNVARQYGQGRVFAVDSVSSSIGLFKLAQDALRMAEDGLAASAITEKLEEITSRSNIYIVAATLEYLHKGGRIGGAAALFGSLLQIKPILTVVDGRVAVLDKVRTQTRALQRIVDELPPDGIEWIGIAQSVVPTEILEQLVQMLKDKTGIRQIDVAGLSPVIINHVGPGAIGVLVRHKP